jgi:hypothetical protein
VTDPPRLSAADLPGIFQAADRTAISAQRLYARGTAARLVLVVAASVAGVATAQVRTGQVNWLALVGFGGFLAAMMIDIGLLRARPERSWYDGRALAESVKTLTWRFVVGGRPFEVQVAEAEAVRAFIDEVDRVRASAPPPRLQPVTAPVVTPAMLELRRLPLAERRRGYLTERVQDQLDWYSRKSVDHGRRATAWRSVLLGAEIVGVVTGLLTVVGVLSVPVEGLVATAVAAAGAWMGVRQYDSLARAYAYAAADLSVVSSRLALIDDEAAWAQAVADAEEAISREHTMWRASRNALSH